MTGSGGPKPGGLGSMVRSQILSGITDTTTRKAYADWLAQRPKERRREPFFWHDERFNLPTLPVTVSWYEAMAYCEWLYIAASHGQSFAIDGAALDTLLTSGNWQLRLPTEAEWEKAAGWDVGGA